jgi:hypothetical protein
MNKASTLKKKLSVVFLGIVASAYVTLAVVKSEPPKLPFRIPLTASEKELQEVLQWYAKHATLALNPPHTFEVTVASVNSLADKIPARDKVPEDMRNAIPENCFFPAGSVVHSFARKSGSSNVVMMSAFDYSVDSLQIINRNEDSMELLLKLKTLQVSEAMSSLPSTTGQEILVFDSAKMEIGEIVTTKIYLQRGHDEWYIPVTLPPLLGEDCPLARPLQTL